MRLAEIAFDADAFQVTVHGKADRLAAERALKQRQSAKFQHRREQYKESLNKIMEEEREALMRKSGLI